MALRLFKARSKSGHYEASEVDADDGPFACLYCPARLVWVRDHWVHREDVRLQRHVPSFYRLAELQSHSENCPQAVNGAVEVVLRQARAVEDGTEALFAQMNDKTIFRLNIPTLLARRPGSSSPTASFGDRIQSIWETGPLENYCRSAVGLAQIWNALDSNADREDLATRLSVAIDGKIIPWNAFSFSPNRYKALLNQLAKKNRHPIAVLISVKSKRRLDNGLYHIQCVEHRIGSERHDVRVAPVIFASEEGAGMLDLGSQMIAFGDWHDGGSRDYKVPNESRTISYHNVVLNVRRLAQLGRIDVPGEGENV